MKQLIVILSALLGCGLAANIEAKQVHKERSIYRNVVIVEEGKRRCMRFETRRRQVTNQACIDMRDPKKIQFEYVQGILAGYAYLPKPKKVLVIGLGGGTLSQVMHEISPEAEITSVDIDPVVVKLAKQYFNYQESDKIKTQIKDGRVFVKRALLKKEQYDWIVLDAFNGDYIPEHLMTQEFLQEVKGLLTPGGLLSANTFSASLLYDYESVTYQKVFGDLQIFRAPTKGNRVIFACNCDSFETFPEYPENIRNSLSAYGYNLDRIWKRISDKVDWNTESPVLTDQYSPANLLKQEN